MDEKEVPTLKAGNTTKNLWGLNPKATPVIDAPSPDADEPDTEIPEPRKSTDAAYFLGRILGLEDRLDRLEDKIALYNLRAAHRI